MSKEIQLLKIRHLITIKEDAIAQANSQLQRGGWTCDWGEMFGQLDAEITAAFNSLLEIEK